MTAEERADLERNGEQRTADQQRHDVVAAIIATAARSGEHPTIGGSAPTVLVSVRAADLEAGHGVAHADGIEIPVSMRAARQLMCTGGT
jgi:5-methylcytosine-specific restriction protein A